MNYPHCSSISPHMLAWHRQFTVVCSSRVKWYSEHNALALLTLQITLLVTWMLPCHCWKAGTEFPGADAWGMRSSEQGKAAVNMRKIINPDYSDQENISKGTKSPGVWEPQFPIIRVNIVIQWLPCVLVIGCFNPPFSSVQNQWTKSAALKILHLFPPLVLITFHSFCHILSSNRLSVKMSYLSKRKGKKGSHYCLFGVF